MVPPVSRETDDEDVVYVVDDNPGVCEALQALFAAAGQACRVYPSGLAFIDALNAGFRGCVLLDQSMPGKTGLEVMETLRAKTPGLPVVMMTAQGDVALAVRAMKAGAFDFIEKPWRRGELFDALERAMRASLATRAQMAASAKARATLDQLTDREREVFDEIVTGATNKAIARKLRISQRTVEHHRASIMQKSQADNIVDLVRLSFQAGQTPAALYG